MYSVHVGSENQNRRSSTKRYTNRSEHRNRQRRPSIRISNANQLIRYLRDNLFNLCSSQSKVPENEYIEYENTSICSKPERIDVLCQLTNFSRRELKIMYREFKNECPDGILREEIFKKIYQNFFPRGTECSNYAHYVFSLFNLESTGNIGVSFTDFILGLSVLIRGTVEEKINWIFRFYDTKKKGYLDKEDFRRVLRSIYEMMSSVNSKACNSKTCSNQMNETEHLEMVFQVSYR